MKLFTISLVKLTKRFIARNDAKRLKQFKPSDDIIYRFNLCYGQKNVKENQFDIYYPKSNDNGITLLDIHGGGYIYSYKENNVEVPKNIAGMMLSAIVSDTLLFKSPTCTQEDVQAAKELAEIAGVDLESYGLEMLKAGTNLGTKSAVELIDLDAKSAKKIFVDLADTENIENTVLYIEGENIDRLVFPICEL